MKTIKTPADNSLYLKVFKSKQHDAICYVYYDLNDEVISFNFHFGTEQLEPDFMHYQPESVDTELYNAFKALNDDKHSTRLFDFVISAKTVLFTSLPMDTLTSVKEAKEEAFKYKTKYQKLKDKVNKAKTIII